ncbi:hypothetical protein [Actinacidiphila oryziradicis]|uniref:Peptidase M41 domain-containing protein n=1 Tax=Actinacidiphila oryziradicis TaxID=2571141 RepID=A0A4U0RE63_9ACTN|nr:hypothetical protein [Actinacidiphila oryziradicis]TJZ93555.1 hypothetical protein FCI23_54490 [Actinacidiphila oryziradicis]
MSSNDAPSEGFSSLAIHEAAHTVACLVEEGTFRYVTLRPRSRLSEGHIYGMRRIGVVARGVISLAGPFAEAILLGDGDRGELPTLIKAGSSVDMDDVDALGLSEEDLTLVYDGAVRLVDEYWEDIVMVAELLEKRRTLTMGEVYQAMWAVRSDVA